MALAHPASGRRAFFLVERTEGDAMRLRAPVEWQGVEEEHAAELGAGCAAGATLRFDCDRLLADAAAERMLAETLPELSGRGAIVNVGAMAMELPAAALAAGTGAEEGGGGGGGGGRMTGKGAGAGEPVLDSDEQWM